MQKYRLRQDSADRQEVTLELFTKGRHRAESRFLHQTSFLDCGYARRVKGPDLLRGTGRNLIREHWSCQWSAGVETALVERSILGSTVAEAANQLLRRRLTGTAQAAEGAALLVQGFLMGIGDIADSMARQVDELLVTDGDFSSLCDACAALSSLEAWQSQYDEAGSYDYPAMLRRCFSRILQMLPSMNTVDDRGVERIQHSCQLLYELTGRTAFSPAPPAFRGAGGTGPAAAHPSRPPWNGAGPSLRGRAGKRNLAVRTAAGYLRGTRDQKLQAAAFLQGLFLTARDLLLTDGIQLEAVDELLCGLSDEDFMLLLPQLRLAFSYFTPTESARIGRQAAQLHGAERMAPGEAAATPEEYTLWEAVDAWAAERLGQPPAPWARKEAHRHEHSRSSAEPLAAGAGKKRGGPPSSGGRLLLVRMDDALDFLYGREAGPDVRRDPEGGLRREPAGCGPLAQRGARPLPQETVEILQRHALDRYHLTALLTDQEVLEQLEPDEALLEMILSLKGMMKGRSWTPPGGSWTGWYRS